VFHQWMADYPEKILALEMGGNNPLVVAEVQDQEAAIQQILLSAYLTSGQRCTCARRLILIENAGTDALLQRLSQRIQQIRVGWYDQTPEPFMGSVISRAAGESILRTWEQWRGLGGQPLVTPNPSDDYPALLTPGLIDMSTASDVPDEECFGPLLQVYRVASLEQAIHLANQTRYGLSAGLLTDRPDDWELFIKRIRAGVVNLNRQTTGASGKLPFGGCGWSGNHRPSGYYAADYCSFPVASLESEQLPSPDDSFPGLKG